MGAMESSELDPRTIKDISLDALDHNGRLRILPSAFWAHTTPQERALFGHQHAIYSFPTIELLEHLRDLIAGRVAIEIGAGNGVLAEALGIPGTDNRMQAQAKYRKIYQDIGHPTVKYGPNVIEMDAHAAVRHYKPDVVIGCWVTHKWNPRRAYAGGNEIGIDEGDVLANTGQYIVIGNDHVHAAKEIWNKPHTRTHPDFLYSRATNGSPDFLAIWGTN